MITFGDAVTKVLQRLALVEGLDAQLYAEPRIQLAIQHKFDLIFREYWLPDYTVYQQENTLDGVTGHTIDDFGQWQDTFDWRDLHSVFHESSSKPLSMAPMGVRDSDITYPCLRPSQVTGKWLKVVPVTTTGKIYATWRAKPLDFKADSDKIYLDSQLLILGACWDVLEDDGTNPGASDKFRVLFQDALSQFNRMQHNIPLSTISPARSSVTQWR